MRYIRYILDDAIRDGWGHVNKLLCALKFYIFETKDNLYQLHRAMFGSAHLKPSQQNTPRPHNHMLGSAYYL